MTRVPDLAPPRNWQDFEDLCLDLFRQLWNAPGAMRNGREFQPQAGVDVFGFLADRPEWFGIQCKKKLGTAVTETELRAEVEKAKGFNPSLARFVLATTARCDAAIQALARELTTQGPFEVLVYDWDHFCADLAGRTELLRKHFPEHYPDDPADLRSHYLRHLMSSLDAVQLVKESRNSQRDIRLSTVYIELDVLAHIHCTAPSKGIQIELKADGQAKQWLRRRVLHQAERSATKGSKTAETADFSRRCTALEAVATAARRVLIGRGGSGKSTFGRYLCLCLAGQLLGHETLDHRHFEGRHTSDDPGLRVWPHGDHLPFFVELRRFVRSAEHFPAEGEKGQARHLVDYLATLGPHDAEMGRVVRGALDSGALVVLDGLDETPAADRVRERLQQVIGSFAETYPDCRILVTSRPYAYEPGQPWRLDAQGFVEEHLAPFDEAKIERFVRDAYAAFAARHGIEDEDLEKLAADLLHQIQSQPSLGRLAEQPLMLTMMTDLHTSRGGRLPAARSTLFEESVVLLFDRWNERRLQESVADLVGMDEEQIRGALELLAFRIHRDAGTGSDQPANIDESQLVKALLDTRRRYGNKEPMVPEDIRDYLNQRSGILIAESPSVYRFPHRFFQEYLAACHLDHFPAKRGPLLATHPLFWREVILFLAGRLTRGDGIWSLLRELAPGQPPAALERESPAFERALLAGLAIREHHLELRHEADHQQKLDDVRDWLRRAVELGALEVPDRAQAGQILGLLGDHRPGVGLGPKGLPDIEWVEIPAGSFTMGSEAYDREKPIHQAHLEGFRISRYPLTHGQYQPFIDDGGYTERWQHCWTEAGWAWKRDRGGPFSRSNPFDLPNHPRIGVSWYEAVAYCHWLSETTGGVYRLPSEAEWERSARGVDGREYPWGGEFDATLCNSMDGGPGTTTAVGLYPGGESPAGANGVGIRDASGNVLEWCSTQWRDSYEEAAKDDLEGDSVRVLRGGGFAVNLSLARCAYRNRNGPDDFLNDVGFRLVAPI